MKLSIEWGQPVGLKDARKMNMIYNLDLQTIANSAGIYIFGRRWHSQFEALYVGKAGNIRSRIKGHFNNLRLMQHLWNAKDGKRIVLIGTIKLKRGQRKGKCLRLAERALIRHFLSEGHDLANKQGTKLRRHELESSGKHPKRFFPKAIYIEKTTGE
jgi:hypothetical protein